MLSRRIVRGVIAHRHLAAAPKQLRCTTLFTQNRYYSDAAGGNGADNTKNEKGATNGKEPTHEQTIEKLKKELEEAKQETLLAYADRQNSIRIAKDDVRKAKEYGIQKFATALLEVNDILERALDAVSQDKLATNHDLHTFYDGVKMTERLMLKVYEQNDVKRFFPMGEKFDPNKHQALQEVPDPSKEPGTVCHVMKAGYQMKDRLLRPAAVVVVKERPKEKEGEKKEEPVASS